MLLLLPSALFDLDLLLLLLWVLFVANNFFISPSDLVESAVAFRCINLMPIVALDNFLEEDDDPPLLFFGLFFCSLEFGGVVDVLAFGLAVPGFHIMIRR